MKLNFLEEVIRGENVRRLLPVDRQAVIDCAENPSAVSGLYEHFDKINSDVFDGLLPTPMICIEDLGKDVLGRWSIDGTGLSQTAKIIVHAHLFAFTHNMAIAHAVLLHEACHEYAWLLARTNYRYFHDSRFTRICREVAKLLNMDAKIRFDSRVWPLDFFKVTDESFNRDYVALGNAREKYYREIEAAETGLSATTQAIASKLKGRLSATPDVVSRQLFDDLIAEFTNEKYRMMQKFNKEAICL